MALLRQGLWESEVSRWLLRASGMVFPRERGVGLPDGGGSIPALERVLRGSPRLLSSTGRAPAMNRGRFWFDSRGCHGSQGWPQKASLLETDPSNRLAQWKSAGDDPGGRRFDSVTRSASIARSRRRHETSEEQGHGRARHAVAVQEI